MDTYSTVPLLQEWNFEMVNGTMTIHSFLMASLWLGKWGKWHPLFYGNSSTVDEGFFGWKNGGHPWHQTGPQGHIQHLQAFTRGAENRWECGWNEWCECCRMAGCTSLNRWCFNMFETKKMVPLSCWDGVLPQWPSWSKNFFRVGQMEFPEMDCPSW